MNADWSSSATSCSRASASNTSSQKSVTRPSFHRKRRRMTSPIGFWWVAAKKGSAAGARQSTSSRFPSGETSPVRPM